MRPLYNPKFPREEEYGDTFRIMNTANLSLFELWNDGGIGWVDDLESAKQFESLDKAVEVAKLIEAATNLELDII